jgi:polyisoprenyl-phosphate glycosyltransferase
MSYAKLSKVHKTKAIVLILCFYEIASEQHLGKLVLNIKEIDIVTSALNEEECVFELYRRISAVMSRHPSYSWRLIFCDNNSTDKTWELINELASNENNVLGIRMSRTFPLDAAFTCGIDLADADAVILMASDLQDPPETISIFLQRFEEGYDQVVARIIKRDHVPILRRQLSRIFYFMANKITSNMIPRGVSDFRLLSRTAYQGARQMKEKNRFLRGLLAWTGYNTAIVDIERPKRFAGDSKFLDINLGKVVRWAIAAILAHTSAPLTAVAVLGIGLSFVSFLATVVFSTLWLVGGVPFAGFGTIVGIVSLGFSLTMLAIGIIAQYVALIYDEVKSRPIYLIAERTDQPGNIR